MSDIAPPEQKDFFVSYNKADKGWAEWIAWQLELDGKSVTIQAWDSLAGTNFALYMQRAIISATRLIAVLSDNYLNSLYTSPEWAAFFTNDPTGEKRLIIPVKVADCDPQKLGLLTALARITLKDKPEAAARAELLEEIRKALAGTGKPAIAPAFPGKAATPTQAATAMHYPGKLPPVWNVPHLRNHYFTGREDLLEQLEMGQDSALVQAISGLGGIGKTQTAVEYAYRNAYKFELVWWVRAEEDTTLRADLESLTYKLELVQQGKIKQDEAIALVINHLQSQAQNWMIVYDNLESPAKIERYLPKGGAGQLVITSRFNGNWGWLKVLNIRKWDQAAGGEFLKKRLQREDPAFAGIVQELDGLPLALEQAAAYCLEVKKEISAYLELFKKRRLELFKGRLGQDPQHETVAVTWDISFEKLQQESAVGAAFLNLCAFFAPDAIPLEIFLEYSKELPEILQQAIADELEFDDALAAATRYSLIEREGNDLSMHRLTQEAARYRLTDEERKQWAVSATVLLESAFPNGNNSPEEPLNWKTCERLLAHAESAASWSEKQQAALEAVGTLFNQGATYLQFSKADYPRAEELFRRSLKLKEAFYGFEHTEVANVLNNLAILLKTKGDLEGAEPLYRRALKIREARLEANHPHLAQIYNNLGLLLMIKGDLEGAEPLYRRSIDIWETTLGKDHPDVAISYNNLASLLYAKRDYDGAETLYRRALEIREATLEANHPNVGQSLNNLGTVLEAKNDHEAAETLYRRAIKIGEITLGKSHPKVATWYNNLGTLLSKHGRNEEALLFMQKAFAIRQKVLGSNHPDTKKSQEWLKKVESTLVQREADTQ